jgi:cobalt-zinc-cadmium efflux system protein
MAPAPILGGMMLALATAGLVVNLLVLWLLHGGDKANLNVRGAFLHVLGDLLGSVAAILASLVILATGWTPVDPLLSILVALLVLRGAWRLVAEAGHILLEGAPSGLDVRTIGPDLVNNVPGVVDIHHVHAWSLTPAKSLLTLHARLAALEPAEPARSAIKARLRDRFGVDHATVEIEHQPCPDGEVCPTPAHDDHRHGEAADLPPPGA